MPSLTPFSKNYFVMKAYSRSASQSHCLLLPKCREGPAIKEYNCKSSLQWWDVCSKYPQITLRLKPAVIYHSGWRVTAESLRCFFAITDVRAQDGRGAILSLSPCYRVIIGV